MATKKLTPAMQKLVRALEVYGYLDPIRDGGRVATYVGLIERGIIRPHARNIDPYFPASTSEQVWDEAHAEHDRRTAETSAHAECPEQWVQVDGGGTEWHTRQSRRGYPIEIERGGHRFWLVRINGRTPMSAGGTFEEARRAADRFEAAQAWADAHVEHNARGVAAAKGATVYSPIDRAAINAKRIDSLMNSGCVATVETIPLPVARETGVIDADGNALRLGDVVRVDGDPTLYGSVYRDDADGRVYGVPLGTDGEWTRIDATRMRRVERQTDGSFLESASILDSR